MAPQAKLKFPPGPSFGLRRWSLGPLHGGDPLKYFTRVIREYGDVVGLRVLNFRILLINHPDHIEELLVTHPRKFIKGRVLQANKRVFASEYMGKIYLVLDAFLKHRTDGALIRVSVDRNGDDNRHLEDALEFAAQLPGILPKFLPQ